jgi:hypothetical protein
MIYTIYMICMICMICMIYMIYMIYMIRTICMICMILDVPVPDVFKDSLTFLNVLGPTIEIVSPGRR